MLVTASTDLFLFTKMVSKEDYDILLALKEKTSIHRRFATELENIFADRQTQDRIWFNKKDFNSRDFLSFNF